MKTNYKPTMTLKKAGLMMLPGAIGGAILAATAVLEMIQKMEGEITLSRVGAMIALALTSIIVAALTGGLRALENWVKNSGVIMVLFVAGACMCFSGCLSLTPYSSGSLSSNNVKVVEETAHADGVDRFALEIKSRGEAAAKTSVTYSGEAEADETPWNFAVLGEANVNSVERVKPLTEGAGAALAALPSTLAPLVEALSVVNDAPEGTAGASIRDRIMGLIMEKLFDAIAGGATQ